MPEELANAKRAIDAWSKLSWTQQQREIDKVREQNLAALKADKRLFIAALPDGTSMTGTPWEIYREKARLGYLKSWERMLGTLSNIEGGIGGTVGYALGGEEGAEIGARIFDDPANALGQLPESSRGTEARGTEGRGTGPVEFQHGAPLVQDGIRIVLKPPVAPVAELPPAPKEPTRKPPPPPEVSNRKLEPPKQTPTLKPPAPSPEPPERKPPPKEPPARPTQGTANRFGDESKPPVVPFQSIDLPLTVLPSKKPTPSKASAKAKKPAPAVVGAAPAQQSNTAQAGSAPKKKSAPTSPAVKPSNKPPENSAASDANKLVDGVARGLSKPQEPAKAKKPAKPAPAINEGFRPSPVPDSARHEKDSANTLEKQVAKELRDYAKANKLPEPLQDKSFGTIAKKLAEQARENSGWNVPDNIEKTLEKELQPTREALLKEMGFGDIVNVLRKWYQKKAAAARADLNQIQSRSAPREKKAMRDLVSDLERTEPFPGYEEENASEAEDLWSRNDLNEEQKAAYENLKNSLRLQRDLEGTLRAKISRTEPDNLVFTKDLSFTSVVDATEKVQEPAHQLKLAVDREVATRLVEELTRHSGSSVPSPREVPQAHSALEVLPGGGKNYIPTSMSDIRAKMTEFLRWRLSKINVTEGVTPDVVDAAQKLGTEPRKNP